MKPFTKDTKVVLVSFKEGATKSYAYYTDLDLEVMDKVEVPVGSEGKLKEVIVTSTTPDPEEGKFASKWVIRKLDDDTILSSITYSGVNGIEIINFLGVGNLTPSSTINNLRFLNWEGEEVEVKSGDVIERMKKGFRLKEKNNELSK